MIYILAGAPRVGKTIIANDLAAKLGVELISTDPLCERVKNTLSEPERRRLFPMTNFSFNPEENTMSVEERIEQQFRETESLQPEIEKLIQKADQSHGDSVFEGVHFRPAFIRELQKAHEIKALFLLATDFSLALESYLNNSSEQDWLRDGVAGVGS
ncbi:MAG: hypothetical protein V1821_02445 [bacterium]